MTNATIIIDLDGPILDTSVRHYCCYRAVLEDHGVRPVEPDVYWHMKRAGVTLREQLEISGRADLEATFIREWIQSIESSAFLSLDTLQPLVLDTLRCWRSSGYRLFLATMRRYPSRLHVQLRTLGIEDLFDEVVRSNDDQGAAGKAAAVQARLPDDARSKMLWVGDTEADVQAARALGCPVCAVTCGLRDEAFLRILEPDLLAATISEITPERVLGGR